jgi:general secretion pathway protein J
MSQSPPRLSSRFSSITQTVQTGFTLIELLVAVSLMAVLAVICWRGLDSVLRARDSLGVVGDNLKAMTVAFTQIDEDLRRSWPMRQLVVGAPTIRVIPPTGTSGAANTNLEIELLREGGGALDPVRAERVRYRVKDGQLERGFAPYALGASAQITPMIWQQMLMDVTQISYRVWVKGQGWVAAESLVAATNTAGTSTGASSVTPPSGIIGATGGALAALTQPEILGVQLELARTGGDVYRRTYSVRD